MQLLQLNHERERVTVTIAHREIRKWLRTSTERKAMELAVGYLLRAKEDSP